MVNNAPSPKQIIESLGIETAKKTDRKKRIKFCGEAF